MIVELVAYTPCPDDLCDMSAKTCVSAEMPRLNTVYGADTPKRSALKGALKSGHESVVEHASFTFAISGVSRALTHQLVRHRLASYSQQSQRYVKMGKLDMVVPETIRVASETELMNGGGWSPNGCVHDDIRNYMMLLDSLIERLRSAGIPEEDIRYFYPNGCKTNIVVTMNARQLMHFFRLRCCERAQWEIREMANRMLELCKEVAPVIFEDAGASCVQTGRCPEGKKSCGKVRE